MIKKYISIKQLLVILMLFQIIVLSGCTYSTNDEEVENMNCNEDPLDKNDLTENILKLNPYLEENLKELSIEELQEIHEELIFKKEQRINDRLKEVDENDQLDEESMKHHQNPNPPQPPIYEKPKPIPDPPIEEK